ncbi:DUF134 domain-containing protein [Verrucomicrobiota bacterium]
MVRPHKPRRIGHRPDAVLYKPAGIPASRLNCVELSLDELEALRLADSEHLDQASVAEKMNVSRPTVGRILASGREKVAKALSHGMAISIEAGPADLEFYDELPRRGCCKGCRNRAEENDD